MFLIDGEKKLIYVEMKRGGFVVVIDIYVRFIVVFYDAARI